tara:strand:- start:424 stop:606 length:183 start_codon:yes stop_codon:yes gene_type:complete
MKLKETIKLVKKALKHPEMYDESELRYLRQAKKKAKAALKLQQLKKLQNDSKTDSNNTET